MCVCLLTENHRRGIASTIAVTNGILSLLGLCVIGIGVYIRTRIDELLSVLTDYDGIPFTSYVISVGCLVFVVHSMVAIFAYDWSNPLKSKRKSKKPPGRPTTISWVCMVGHCLFAIIAVVAGVLCYGHRYVFDRVLDRGFLDAMSRYKNEQTAKEHIDRLQRDFMCCGSRSYKDWFETSWIHKDYIDVSEAEKNMKMKHGMYYTDDTPFSCCSAIVSRPCVHTRVMGHADHTYHGNSLYRIGCAEALRIYFESNILAPTGHVLVFMATLQIVSTILWRMLQSSYTSAMSMYGDPLLPGIAYCCRPRTKTADVESSIQSPQSDAGQYIADTFSPEDVSQQRYDNAPDEVRGLLEERRHSNSHVERSDERQHDRTHDNDDQKRQHREGPGRQSSRHTSDRDEHQASGHKAKQSNGRSPDKHIRNEQGRTQDKHTRSSKSDSKQSHEQSQDKQTHSSKPEQSWTQDKHTHSSKLEQSRTQDKHTHSSKPEQSRTQDKHTHSSKPDSKQSHDRTLDKRTRSSKSDSKQSHEQSQDKQTHSSKPEQSRTQDKHTHSSKPEQSRTQDKHTHSSKPEQSRTQDKHTHSSKPDSKQSHDRTLDKRTSSPERQSRSQTRDSTRTPEKRRQEKSLDRSKERSKEKRDASKSPRQESRKSASPSRKPTSPSARPASPSRTPKSSSPKSPKQKARSKSPKPSKRKRK